MKYKESILKGLSAQAIADVAGVSKASVYNWCDGRGRLVGPLITAAIESLLKEKTDDGNHGREQELELEGSISSPTQRSLA